MVWQSFCAKQGCMGMPAGSAIDWIWSSTQPPPKHIKPSAATNRSPSQGMQESCIQPLVNSTTPVSANATHWGIKGKNHRRTKDRATFPKMTHAHMDVTADAARCIPLGNVVLGMCAGTADPGVPDQNIAMVNAEKVWISSRITGTIGSEKKLPITPKTKAGPQLLQNPNIRRASECSIGVWAMHCAPTGKPPTSPSKKIPSLPCGMRQSRDSLGSRSRTMAGSIRLVTTSMGNRDGITVYAHCRRAFAAAFDAHRLSKIKHARAPQQTALRHGNRIFFNQLTSQESMHQVVNHPSLTHRIWQGGDGCEEHSGVVPVPS